MESERNEFKEYLVGHFTIPIISFVFIKERERERERETHDTYEQIADEQLIKPFYMPYLATSIFQPVTTITQEFL